MAAWTVTASALNVQSSNLCVAMEGGSRNFEKFLIFEYELRFELNLVFWDLC